MSTALLLDETRGLVQALMGWAHERSQAQGHLLQAMIGVPNLYGLFGYDYAVDIPWALGALLFGPHGMAGLARIRPDVCPGPDVELFTALFPSLTADLLTCSMPW